MIDTYADRINPIETRYDGYLFRSRLEARWAVFLDSLGEEWGYEVEGFKLKEKNYLPDFWLPRLECWLEIKGIEPNELEINLCESLAWETNYPVILAWGLPTQAILNPNSKPYQQKYWVERMMVYCGEMNDGGAGCPWFKHSFWALDLKGKLCICANNNRSDREFCTPDLSKIIDGIKLTRDTRRPIPKKHINKAKSARFGF